MPKPIKTYIDEEGHTVRVFDDGTKFWFKNGEIHRDGDKPACVYKHGEKRWFKNGKHHRERDKPAVVYEDGRKFWYKNGKRHRDGDKPATIIPGEEYWLKNGKIHRENNAAIITWQVYTYCLNNLEYEEKEYWVRLLLVEY